MQSYRLARLLLNVLLYHFVRYVPCTGGQITARPKMISTKLFFIIRKLLKEDSGTYAFQPLDDHADLQVRPGGDENLYDQERGDL